MLILALCNKVLASSWMDKTPSRSVAIPCHCPKHSRNVLGYILESKSKISDTFAKPYAKVKGAFQTIS
nr:cobalamine-independent methionine synthase [Tanacetum cinerariifolium]